MKYLTLLCLTLASVIFGPSSQAAVDGIPPSISGQDVVLTAPAAVGELPADVVVGEGPVQHLDAMIATMPGTPMFSPEVVRRVFFTPAEASMSTISPSLRAMLRSTRWRSTPIRTDQEAVPRCTG